MGPPGLHAIEISRWSEVSLLTQSGAGYRGSQRHYQDTNITHRLGYFPDQIAAHIPYYSTTRTWWRVKQVLQVARFVTNTKKLVCVRCRAATVSLLVSLPDDLGYTRQISELAQPASSILWAHRGPTQATTDADRFQTCVKRQGLYSKFISDLNLPAN